MAGKVSIARCLCIFFALGGFVLCFIPLSAIAESLPTSDASSAAISSVVDGVSASALSSGSSSSVEFEIEPLDNWNIISAPVFSEAQSSSLPSSSKDTEYYNYYEDELLQSDEDEDSVSSSAPIVIHRNVRLTSAQRAMLDRVRQKIARRQRKISDEQIASYYRDKRGAAEIRICSANLDIYGLAGEVQKLAAKLKVPKGIDRAFIDVVKTTNCGVIAVQGITAREPGVAQLVLEQLTQKLQKATETEWQGYLGGADNGYGYNAFLLKSGPIRAVADESGADLLLPRFDQFKLKKFPRGPLVLVVNVPGQDDKPSRRVFLINFSLREKVGSIQPAPKKGAPKDGAETKKPAAKKILVSEEARNAQLQLAEGVRQMVEYERRTFEPGDAPILVALGDRDALPSAPAAFILDGRIRLNAFKGGTPCHLTSDGKAVCDPPRREPQVLFGLFGSNLKGKGTRVHDGFRAKLPSFPLSTDIFLLQEDLPLALEHHDFEGRYNIGFVPLKNGLKSSPLLWVDLNW